MHLTRYFMYQRISRFFKEAPRSGRVLAVSGWEYLYPMFDQPRSTLVEANWPQHDTMNLSFPDESFNYVISDQVLEHISNPFRAAGEVRRVLRPGGYAIHTTCFMDRIHAHPSDYWRISCEALKYLHKDYSRIVACESWGNRAVYLLSSLRRRFRFIPVPEHPFSPIRALATHNDPNFPVVTWIIAQK